MHDCRFGVFMYAYWKLPLKICPLSVKKKATVQFFAAYGIFCYAKLSYEVKKKI